MNKLKYQDRFLQIKEFLAKNPGISQRKAAKALNIPHASFQKLIRRFLLDSFFERPYSNWPVFSQFQKVFSIQKKDCSPGQFSCTMQLFFKQDLFKEMLLTLDPNLDQEHVTRYLVVKKAFC
jgi:hypothetical protein